MKELAREKIQKQIKDPPVVKDLPKSKSKKAKVNKPPTKEAQLTKGKSYKSSMNQDMTKKDPNSKDVLIKKYVKDTNAGSRNNAGTLTTFFSFMSDHIKLIIFYFGE